ncbi:MAG: cytochrome c oxidase accessory protein CcoG [Deltaproteobacteria bacterium]|nr:cytochrome c oxidase accessory protein CcoG [Deltaproteobacteria bacterium]
MTELNAPRAGRVLTTLNEDGSRCWIRPRVSKGRFYWARLAVGWLLIVLFVSAPLIRVNGHPLIFLDVEHRQFFLFGATFLATDTMFLMLFLLIVFLSIFWFSALVGRIWCGWGCPQTVYMEFVFRPIERLLEGTPSQSKALDAQGGLHVRRLAKNAVYLVLAFVLANVFLSYFVGVDQLKVWVTQAPWRHPGGFGVVAVTSALVFIDFAYFREQMCTVACPYARLQSVLLDRSSLTIGYDARRGETRRKKAKRAENDGSGDCIDCRACVVVCPTGIDIRDGAQLECVACAQCIDACDAIMDKVGRPRGLIRYASEENLSTGKKARLLRPRVVVYPVLIGILGLLLIASIGARSDVEVTILHGVGAPFVELDGGQIRNQLRVKIANRAAADRAFTLSVPELPPEALLAPQNPLRVAKDDEVTTPIFVTVPKAQFKAGKRVIDIEVRDGFDFETKIQFPLLGP